MQNRAEIVRAAFRRLPGWELQSLGAYFAYVRHPFGRTSAWQIAERLASEQGLLCLPGPAFAGEDAHLRIAFANVDVAGIAEMEERLRAASDYNKYTVVVHEPPLPAKPGDPENAGHHAPARCQNGSEQQHFGMPPTPLLKDRREA
jgi:hypothetical protein